jgi:hypothetical protein
VQVIARFDPDDLGELDFVNFTALVTGSGEDDGTSFESPTVRKPKKRKNVRVNSRPTSIGSIPVRSCAPASTRNAAQRNSLHAPNHLRQ